MPLIIVRNDITKMKVDAIVNAANHTLLGGGGVDGAIHRAAGPGLLAECRTLNGCNVGEAKLTGGYGLPAKFVIHTVGPIWEGGSRGERENLRACYINSLKLASEVGAETVAFPLISSGVYGYPKAEALRVAEESIREFLDETDFEPTVYIVVFDSASLEISKMRFREIEEFISDNYAKSHGESKKRIFARRKAMNRPESSEELLDASLCIESSDNAFTPVEKDAAPQYGAAASVQASSGTAPNISNIGKAIDELMDESFSEMLLRKIDESGMTDSECYKRANIDRKLFSKIRSDRLYKPSKPTVIAFAVALRLSLAETNNMLMKAGFALSHSNKFDLIIEYFIKLGIYDVFEINEALFAFDQSLLGA